jgi:hypothetical protein
MLLFDASGYLIGGMMAATEMNSTGHIMDDDDDDDDEDDDNDDDYDSGGGTDGSGDGGRGVAMMINKTVHFT